ncbi:hypothetical protein N7456_013660 [Penicillium angulare]|uniref:Uncharacterized protein n=1 Tax=Penicillium angulare TaxID=116970 RepID=A0A9W9EFW9_9EURO|nr:hypothetical protein N7456_013660 [Penicillium angulare]
MGHMEDSIGDEPIAPGVTSKALDEMPQDHREATLLDWLQPPRWSAQEHPFGVEDKALLPGKGMRDGSLRPKYPDHQLHRSDRWI